MTDENVNKRIAKNTLFLYFRMLLVMGVTLYTSRVVLEALGVEDYGLYNVIGGIVVVLGFLNGCASSATSRFLTVALGGSENSREHYDYREIFSCAFFIHLVLAILIVVLAETVGLWYFNNKLVIPDGRYNAAMWVYQISIANILVSFTQVPYNASIIAYEKMSVYAYIGIYEAVMKLVTAYLLIISEFDNLIFYAILIFGITASISLLYRIYCVRKFGQNCKLKFVKNSKLYKKLLSYSGWDLIGNFAGSARSQGVNLILNLFCGPAVNAARAIAFQVEAALYQFTTNFLNASRPVIIKQYAAGEVDKSLSLLFETAKFAFLLFSCLAIPVIIESDFILKIWLINPPEYASIFLQVLLVNYMVISLTNTINIGVQATGDVKRLNIYAGSKVFLEIPLVYLFLKWGYGPISAFYVLMGGTTVVIFIDLIVLKLNIKTLSIQKFFTKVVFVCLSIIALPTFFAMCLHQMDVNSYLRMVLVFFTYWIVTLPLILYFGVSKEMRNKILFKIKGKVEG